ncbi:thioredoxin-dependent thiol peroxidase [Flavisolibacter tropicus]|uniref:thioredoxin-dependent peroxiredoxin n=1 Tax=Flavisolibacter tropicus TaxID=1492898 RepID=A0A172TZE3_9BACT|nr:thioredoxin-dependent thiol peroxidase [Flavisolibacter tropicus]ANE52244.1 thiol peroxidase [Flavisolibacter tropicus]
MATHLTVGEKAPVFKGKDQNGNKVSLTDFKGKKVVVFFYPQDDTPVCTVQACNLRDNFEVLQEKGYVVIGVSPDDSASHAKFQAKFQLPYTLIADPDHTIINQYGVWGEKNMYGNKFMGLLRTTFVIDEKGIIHKIFKKPRTKMHAEEIMK